MNCCSPSPPKHKRREKLWKPWKPSLSHGEGRALSRGVLVAPASECGRGRGRCWELQSSAGEVSCFLEAALRSRRAGFAPGALRGVAGVGSVGRGGGDGAAHLPPWTGEGTGNFRGFSRGLAALVRSVSPELPSFLCTCYGNSVLYVFATYKNSHEYLQMYPHR